MRDTVRESRLPQRIAVELGDRSYEVYVGSGVRHCLPELVAATGASKAAVVTARPREWVPDIGLPTMTLPVQDGERNKTLAAVEGLCRRFAEFGLTRSDVVVSCGGGTTTDLVGLAAALYHRGVPVIHLPTSLLAQVDASIGGKTAVNLPEGKNLVGAYWQPRAVLCDTDHLIARCHFIGAGDLRQLPLPEQIAASVRLKASVVAADERDTGRRHILNYGHTLGHALDQVTNFAVRHGEAVAIGTVFAGRLAGALERIPPTRVAEHGEVVGHYGLPTRLPADVKTGDLISLMRLDKKATRGLSFVLDGPSGVELVSDVPEDVVRRVLAEMDREPGPTEGNKASFNSAPHGAGRNFSRSETGGVSPLPSSTMR